jgi:formylglycine-generating enzyme required for sulfatase activity
MSPEQARGDKTDHRTDIYSLGIVLYEMLAGRVPFEADSTMAVIYMQIHTPPPPITDIPEEVQAVMDRALVKDPNSRYQTSREMAIDFFLSIGMSAEAKTISDLYAVSLGPTESPLQPAQTKSEPAKPEPTPAAKPARRRAWIGAGIFSFICLLALGAGAWGLFSALPGLTNPTATLSPTSTNPVATVSVPVTGNLPKADGMVEIVAGPYEVGLSQEDEYHNPPQTITLDGFWIDQYQTTNAQYQRYITETGALPPEVWPGEPNQPVRGVTWDQALAYCTWMKKRLPTEAEWEASGRGPGTLPQLYPWGNDVSAEGQAIHLPDQDTYEVGTQSFNQSPFGVFDMVGNIWEWVGEPYVSGPQGQRILRGGRFGLPVNDLAYRLAVPPDDTRYVRYAGFRCAADEVEKE